MHYCYIISKVHVKIYELIDDFQTMLHGILCLKALHVAVHLIFVLTIAEWKNFFFVINCSD